VNVWRARVRIYKLGVGAGWIFDKKVSFLYYFLAVKIKSFIFAVAMRKWAALVVAFLVVLCETKKERIFYTYDVA